MHTHLLSYFEPVLNDNTSGSGKLLSQVIKVFKTNFVKISVSVQDIINVIHHLEKHFATFPVILHFLGHLKIQTPKERYLSAIINDYESVWNGYLKKQVQRAEEKVNPHVKNIMVNSHSSTVVNLLLHLQKKKRGIHVFQPESRPAFEGRHQATELLNHNFKVTFFVDAMSGQLIKEVDIVILGADILSDTVFINKTGSLQTCLLARYHQVPVMLIADPRKRVHDHQLSCMPFARQFPANEVWDMDHENLNIVNQYFEKIPLELIDIPIS